MKTSLKPTLFSSKSYTSSSNGSSSNGSLAPPPPKKKGEKKASRLLRTTLRNNAFGALHDIVPADVQYNVPRCTVLKLSGRMFIGRIANPCANNIPEDVIVELDDVPKEADLLAPVKSSQNVILKLDDGFKPKIGRINVHYLVVSSNNEGDLGVMYAITWNQTFKEINEDYADKVDCRVKDMFLTNSRTGVVISPLDVACYVGLKHGDMLHASHKNSEANMDAWIKKFYIAEVSDNPRKVKVEGRLDTKLSNIYHMWGDVFNFDPKKVMLMNQCRVLSPSQTIASAKIRNKGFVYALPNVRYHRCVRDSDNE